MVGNRWIDCHNHTHFSNIRLIDAICRPRTLANRAKEIGLKGICFTEHECLSESIEICEMREDYPELKFGIGNELYLCDDRSKNQHYNHFILVAMTPEAHKQLRILSSRAWLNSYFDRGMERVVTTKDDLREIVMQHPGELIATSACLSSELSVDILKMDEARKQNNVVEGKKAFDSIQKYIEFMLDLFGDNFYLEIPPGASDDQIIVNRKLLQLSDYYHIKYEISCDSHYVAPEDRFVHKSFLLSKNGERESIDDFYKYSYLQDTNDIIEHLSASFGDNTEEVYNNAVLTSKEIYDKIEEYDLRHPQTIPRVPVPNYPKKDVSKDISEDKYPNLVHLYNNDNDVKRYWVNQCINFLHKKGLDHKSEYLAELEKEADIKRVVGDRLNTNMYAYPVTLQYYIDLIWECGSTVSIGRGSSCSGLNHWCLGITSYDPIPFGFPFERYMNWETRGLGDIDLDLCNSKRPIVLQKIKEERGARFNKSVDDISRKNLGCTLVATFGTASTKRAIQIACAGYRSDDYPEGIDIDESKYISSLVPAERGFLWNLKDVYYGNEEKGRNPIKVFKTEVNKFPGLFEIMEGVEGLIVSRASHASGIILQDEDPYEFGCYMRTPSGDVITQYDLESAEQAGMTKYDFLITSIQQKLTETINMLQEYGKIEKNLTLRQAYDKYISPEAMDFKDEKVWDAIDNGTVLNMFQFESEVGAQGIKEVQPRSLNDLSNTNGIIRLMAEDGKERPLDKFVRYKNDISLWYKEMKGMGLTEHEMKVMEKYLKKSYGLAISQECIMWSLMDPEICGFTLAESTRARKIISKKKMDQLPKLKEKILKQAKSPAIGNYEWEYVVLPSAGYGFENYLDPTNLTNYIK